MRLSIHTWRHKPAPESTGDKPHPSHEGTNSVSPQGNSPLITSRVVLGKAGPGVEPRPAADQYRPDPYRPDSVVDSWSTDRMIVRAASVRGDSHRHAGVPRQDDLSVAAVHGSERIVFAVADGVSSAPFSHLGSTTAVRYATQWLKSHSTADPIEVDWTQLVHGLAWTLQEQHQRLDPEHLYTSSPVATTIVCGSVEATPDGLAGALVSIGDSGAWAATPNGILPIAGGKDASAGSNVVAALPLVPAQIEPHPFTIGIGEALLVGTDGIGDPLGNGHGELAYLLWTFAATQSPATWDLLRILDFTRETFDDDRTLIVIRPRGLA